MIAGIFHEIYISDISTILLAIPILLLVWSVIGTAFYKYMRIIGAVFAAAFILVILYITILSRNEDHLGVDLIPFSSFERAKLQPEMYRSMLMNVFLFVPLGISLTFVFGGGTAKRILLTILAGFLLSAIVEAVQYFGALGMTETDDVICNTLGTAIGTCAYPLTMLWRKLIRNHKERRT